MLDQAKQYLIDKGLTLVDIPKAVIIHETLGISLLLMIWSGCYVIRPSHHLLIPFKRRFPKYVELLHHKVDSKLNKYRIKMKLNQGKLFNWIEKERLLISLAESVVTRNLLRPVTVPLKLYITYKIILLLKPKNSILNMENNTKN